MSGYVFWGLIGLVILGGGLFLHFRYPVGSKGRSRLKWAFRAVVLAVVAVFLNYSMPSHDIVRVTNTYNRLTTVSWENAWAYASPDTGTAESATSRDVRFIDAAYADGSVVVYRNEDTGWVWPPYFKYDSSNLQAEAQNFKSTKEAPEWVVVTRYGWRFPFLSIYPNAIQMKAVAGPDVRIIPWVNIIILTVLALLALMIRRMWLQFRERMVDPAVADAGDFLDGIDARADAAHAEVRGLWGRMMAWFGTWTRKPPR